jgi:hypothetical protein
LKINLSDFSPPQTFEKPKLKVCPARCHNTGKCYGSAYFKAKYAKPVKCMPNNCEFGFENNKHP